MISEAEEAIEKLLKFLLQKFLWKVLKFRRSHKLVRVPNIHREKKERRVKGCYTEAP